LALS